MTLRSPYDREILALALPALGALAAEPLYLLVDTAMVGHLGTQELAALAIAGTLITGVFALMQPANGAVFALDGILIGAGDTRFLMWGMLAASFGVYVPVALGSLALGLGIVGVWAGLLGLIAVRLATCGWRFRGRRWAIVGAQRAPA